MAAVAQLFFLLVALIYNIQAHQIIELRYPGYYYDFHPPKENNFCLISKFVGEDKFVLWNTSDPSTENSTLPEDLKQRLTVGTDWNSKNYYRIKNLIHSDSGLYQEECWTEDKVTRETNFSIVVCGKINVQKRVETSLGGTSEITCDGAAENLTVQWLQGETRSWRRVFKDNTTSLVNSLQETIQKVENTSTLRVSNIRDNKFYMCLVMNQQQCVSRQHVELIMTSETIIHSVEETAALQCPDDITDQPPDDITDQPPDQPPDDITDQPPDDITDKLPVWKMNDGHKRKKFDQMKKIFSTKNRYVDQNNSLVFSSLTLNHTDVYSCGVDNILKQYYLLVCPTYDPPAVELFSEGDEVTLRCNISWRESWKPEWFIKLNQTEGKLISMFEMKRLTDRFNISDANMSLIISNVSVEDTGEYWCVDYSTYNELNSYGVLSRFHSRCVSASKTLVKFREPVVVSSPVPVTMSSLFIVLLVMVCVAVLTVILKTRRGEQPPADTVVEYENVPMQESSL